MSDEIVVATSIPEKREFQLNRPGNISFADPRGAYPGCLLVAFDTPEEANEYFTKRGGLLVVDIQIGNSGKIFMMVSKQMDEEEFEEFQEYQSIVSVKMNEWRQRKADAKAAELEAKAKEERELDELIAAGKQALAELKHLKAEHEKLKEKYNYVKAELKKAGKK